jgi:hypothetical protein
MRGRPGDADPSGRVTEPQHGNREFLRAGQGLRHSHSDRVHPGPASDAGPVGTDPRLRVILFTVDETVYSRELAPLAGTYPSVRLGAPWWFLDSPEGMRRFRESATETAGFSTPPALWTTHGRTRPYPLGTTSSVASMPAISRVWSWSIGSAWTRRWRRPSTWRTACPRSHISGLDPLRPSGLLRISLVSHRH